MSTNASSIVKGSLYLSLPYFLTNLATFVSFVFVGRSINTLADFGTLSTLQVFAALLSTIVPFALPTTLIRFGAKLRGNGQIENVRWLLKKGLHIALILAFIVTIITFVISEVISLTVLGGANYSYLVKIFCFYIFFQTLNLFLPTILFVFEEFRYIGTIQSISSITRTLLVITTFSIYPCIESILVSWIIAEGFSSSLLLLKGLTFIKNPYQTSISFKPIVIYASKLFPNAILGNLSLYIDRYVVAVALGTAAMGIYTPVFSFVTLFALLLSSLDQVMLPFFSKKYGEKGQNYIVKSLGTAWTYIYIILLPAGVGAAILAEPLITTIFGARFSAGHLPLTILSITLAVTAGGSIYNAALLSLGKLKIITISSIASLLISTALMVLLIPSLNLVAVAIGKAFMYIIQFLFPTFMLRKEIINKIDWMKFAKISISTSIMAILVFTLTTIYMGIYMLPIYSFVGACCYVAILSTLRGINSEDVFIIKELTPKRMHFIINRVVKLLNIS